MRSLLTFLALLILPLQAAEPVPFDKDDRFTIEFPATWKKPEQPKPGAILYRERKTGDASFSVSRLLLPPNAKADLHDTLKTFVSNFRKGGMTIVGDVKGQGGLIDGKTSVFAEIPAKVTQGDDAFDLAIFLVLLECSDRVLVMQATLADGGSNAARADCRKIIGSFHEKDPANLKKEKEEGKEDDKKPTTKE